MTTPSICCAPAKTQSALNFNLEGIFMIARFAPQQFPVASRRLYNIVSVTVLAASFFLVGCGGGGSSIAGVSPNISDELLADSRATLVDAQSRAFAPNYNPRVESDGTWSGRTLRVFIPASAEAYVVPALNRWVESTGSFFNWNRVATKEEAQVSFTMVPLTDFTGGAVGKTRYTYNTGRNELLTAEVLIADTGSDTDKIRVAVHEFGHALGIHGHSDTEPDVMYPTLTTRNVITERDLNTLFYIYRNTVAGNGDASRSVGQEKTVTLTCGANE